MLQKEKKKIVKVLVQNKAQIGSDVKWITGIWARSEPTHAKFLTVIKMATFQSDSRRGRSCPARTWHDCCHGDVFVVKTMS